MRVRRHRPVGLSTFILVHHLHFAALHVVPVMHEWSRVKILPARPSERESDRRLVLVFVVFLGVLVSKEECINLLLLEQVLDFGLADVELHRLAIVVVGLRVLDHVLLLVVVFVFLAVVVRTEQGVERQVVVHAPVVPTIVLEIRP